MEIYCSMEEPKSQVKVGMIMDRMEEVIELEE